MHRPERAKSAGILARVRHTLPLKAPPDAGGGGPFQAFEANTALSLRMDKVLKTNESDRSDTSNH